MTKPAYRSVRPRTRLVSSALAVALVGFASAARGDEEAAFELRRGDHVGIIGNTLADRIQHDGWLETLLQSRFPEHGLVFRNLGFSGDELTTRLRSASFGSPDDWLRRCQADVVFAFFGYNESFAGEAGLEKFKADLANFIRHTGGQDYSGKGAARLVLFSPIAHEDLGDRNLPDGRENNRRIGLYTRAMAEVAREHGVPFVDLYRATRELYTQAEGPLTINGVHLNERGNFEVARIIERALLPGEPPRRDARTLETLREAVLDKNFHWFHRYRTTDGYSIYGGRADLKFVDGQTNREVMQREMEILDVMTANRDQRIHALAQGRDLQVDDSNTPPFIPVTTNKPGAGPNGEHLFLGGEEAISKMTVAQGMRVNLFACEEQFPELISPVQMAFDTKGRLWVATWPTYPHWTPKGEMNDRLLIFEDTTGDGRADVCKTFAGDLHNPTGFEFWNGGVLVAQAPDVWFLKDTTGDDQADLRVRVISGICSADTHHAANSFTLDPGGALYFQEGTFHHSQVETPWGPPVRLANAGVFRYEPRTHKFEVYVSHGFANPHGHVFDRWGQDIVVDGTGANPYHGTLFSGRIDFPQKHNRPPQVYQQRTRPCSGIETLSSRHFPDENQGNLLVANVIGFHGILRYRIEDKGSSYTGTEVEPIVSSSDPNFRPADIEMGPDGAIYFIDWHNPIIGHMQHNLRDPSRNKTHGRVYRVTYPDRPLLEPAKIAGEPVERLLDLLKEPEDRVRYWARIELSGRDSDEVVAATARWMGSLDQGHPDYEHHLLEALWVHQHHNVVNERLLRRMLGSPEFRARAAAARVLCYWRDRVSGSLELFKKLAADEHPRVRLEAVRAASFYTVPEAVEVPLIAAEFSSDEYLDYTQAETMKVLEPQWKRAVAEGREIAVTTEAGARFFLRNTSLDRLLTMDRNRGVYLELMFRPGVRDEHRREAVAGLARLENKGELPVLLEAIRAQDARPGEQDESIVFDLVRLLAGYNAADLAAVGSDLEELATGAQRPVTRQLGFVALTAADGDVERAWSLALRSATALRDLLDAMPLIPDPSVRARLYPKVEPLLEGLPPQLASSQKTDGTYGRYVRVELPGRERTLTLAEVEVYSDGRNVARQGKATQKNTAHGGAAQRGIDGNKSGNYSDGGQTHSVENTPDPWWEVDLGREFPIDSIAIYTRTEGTFANRLNGFTLKVLDNGRNVVFVKERQPAPKESVTYDVGGDGPESVVRRAAMGALTSVRGQEAAAFQALARFVQDDRDRHAAIQALQRIPARHWPADQAPVLLDGLVAWVRELPPQDRTSPAVLDALQFADALAALLPADQARSVRRELGELGVRVVRLGTVPHQMIFDKERIVVQAGKPVEIVFENTDLMPHNVVFIRPGSLQEIGELAEATATDPGALARHYAPQSDKVMLASELLQPRQSQRLSFTAPTEPGVYPYVCTYPGHWRRMYGALYVVGDLEQYQAGPEDYLAAHPLPIQDELLQFNRPRKEWTQGDFVTALEELGHGRSFGNGRQMFQVANCAACHKLDDVGREIGPDLAKLEPQYTAAEILCKILEPSTKINEKYQTWIFETEAGRIVTGLVVEETPELVKVLENPLATTDPVVLRKSEIVEREKSKNSIMPKGLVDRLSREEILDLVAYLAARGDQQRFQEGHGRGGGHEGH